MNINYDVTYELKGDLGYCSPADITFHSIDSLKARLHDDYFSDDYRIAVLDITFDGHTVLSFEYPSNVTVFALCGDAKVRLARFEPMRISDIIFNLEEYVNLNFYD